MTKTTFISRFRSGLRSRPVGAPALRVKVPRLSPFLQTPVRFSAGPVFCRSGFRFLWFLKEKRKKVPCLHVSTHRPSFYNLTFKALYFSLTLFTRRSHTKIRKKSRQSKGKIGKKSRLNAIHIFKQVNGLNLPVPESSSLGTLGVGTQTWDITFHFQFPCPLNINKLLRYSTCLMKSATLCLA